jgi:hypothetical protein
VKLLLSLLLLLPFTVLPCCCFKKRTQDAKAIAAAKTQSAEKKEHEAKPELHSFLKEVTNVDVAKQDLKIELRDVAETLTAIGLNEGTKLVAKTAVAAVL